MATSIFSIAQDSRITDSSTLLESSNTGIPFLQQLCENSLGNYSSRCPWSAIYLCCLRLTKSYAPLPQTRTRSFQETTKQAIQFPECIPSQTKSETQNKIKSGNPNGVDPRAYHHLHTRPTLTVMLALQLLLTDMPELP